MKNSFLTSIINRNRTAPEFYDTKQQMHIKLSLLAKAIKTHKNILLVTGAGISTSSGIPDYRSPKESLLKVGAGQYNRETPLKFKPVTYAIPTYTHRAITQLVNFNKLNMIITQNVDNLHSKAFTTSTKLLEIHGNVCKQYCELCGKLHYRNYYCRDRNREKNSDHYNGRNCKDCSGKLMDSLVFFGESYKNTHKSMINQIHADMVLAVGTSLMIPAMQRLIKRLNVQTHVVNIQKVCLEDSHISNQIHYPCDEVFEQLMKQFNLSPKPFKIMYNLRLLWQRNNLRTEISDFENIEVDAIKSTIIYPNSNRLEEISGIQLELYSYHEEPKLILHKSIVSQLLATNKSIRISWQPGEPEWSIQ